MYNSHKIFFYLINQFLDTTAKYFEKGFYDDIIIMRKKSILKKARYLSQAEETSCIVDKQYSETKENEDSSSSEKSKLNTEIRTFDEDTNNELYFYLDDEEINNATEKCQKSSTYINWRGMDFVNLVLNEETDHNISNLVNCWNKKQRSFEKKIQDKTTSTCTLKHFDYCAVLKKNDNCTSPYKDSDIPGLISLTYNQLSEEQYESNKTKIIYDRLTKFTNITSDISNYYYKVYEANKSQLNCGKWSMYIHKRGKQFVNMVYYEFYLEESFREDSTKNWNTYSNNLQSSILRDTGNRCNMTSLIYQIKERQNSTDPYGLAWITPESDQNTPNETLSNTTTLPDNLEPTMETSSTPHVSIGVDPLYDEAKANIGGFSDSIKDPINAIASPDDKDKDSIAEKAARAAVTASLKDPPQSNSLTPNHTIHSNTNTIFDTISPSPSPEIVISPTTKILPSDSTISSGKPTVTSLPEEISSTNITASSTTIVESFTNNITPSSTITTPPTTASLPPETSTSLDNTFTVDNEPSINKMTSPITAFSSKIIPSHSTITTTSTNEFKTPLHSSTPTISSSLNEYASSSISNIAGTSIDTELHTNVITPSKTYTSHPETSSLPSSETAVNKIISTNGNTSLTNDSESPTIKPLPSPEVEPSLRTITGTPTDSSTPPLTSSTPMITTLPSTSNSISPTDNTEHPTSTMDYAINGQISSSIFNATDSLTNTESSASNTTYSAATSSFFPEIKPSATTSSTSSETISPINHDSPTDDINTSTINYESINSPEASTTTPQSSIPDVVYPTTVTESFNDKSILPTTVVTHVTATSPLTNSSTHISTNTIDNSITTIQPFTNGIASSTTDDTSPAIHTTPAFNTTSPTSGIISPTPLSYYPEKTPILTTTTAFFPITNSNLPSNQTDTIQVQNQQNTHAPFIQAQQQLLENNTGYASGSPNATLSNNFLTPTPSNEPTNVVPTVKPTGNLLIPMVSGGIFILGIIFLLVLLCKYTPIVSWIRNRKSKKKKARKKIKKITREPLLMDTNNTKNEPINNENYSFLHHEKEIPLCDMGLKNRKDLKYKQEKKSKAHKGMYMKNEKDLKYKQVKKSKAHKGVYMQNEKDLKYEQIKKSKVHEGTYMEKEKDLKYEQMKKSKVHKGIYMENEKDLKYEQIKKSKAHEGMHIENETDLKYEQIKKSKAHEGMHIENETDLNYEQMKKSKAHKGMYMENENKCIREIVDVSNKHENELILGENLYEDNPRNEIEENELNVNKSRNKIKEEKLNKNILGKNTVNVEYIMENTLNEEETNEINVIKEKYECEDEMKNLENKRSINDEVRSWNTWINVHMIALLECKKEEWKLNKNEFFKICLEELKKDEKNTYLKEEGNNLAKKGEEENITVMIEKNSSILEKWKKEEWFINLKKEWKREEEKHLKYLEEPEIENVTVEEISNLMLEEKKKVWKKWIERQRKHSHIYKKQNWFEKLLEEYENEEIHKNIKEEKIEKINAEKLEKERNNGIDKSEMKKNLEQKILIDILMMVLEECINEEWEKEEEEFIKTNIQEMRTHENLDEEANILDKIGKEGSWSSILEKKKEEIKKWKKEKWFVELMLDWKKNEQKYLEELNKTVFEKKNEERIANITLERKNILWKKHWEYIIKKWKKDYNNEEWITKLVDEYENKGKEYKNEIYKNSIDIKRENGETRKNCESIIEINKNTEEKMRKHVRNQPEGFNKNINSIDRKKLKWKAIIEIYMIILQEYRKEEWSMNRGNFLEICLEEFLKEEKEEYLKIIENDLAVMREGDENNSTIMIEKQKLLWKKWVKRNKSMLKKWKDEEWFIMLKKEWENSQEKYEEATKESKMVEIEVGKNPMLEKQKIIWKRWIKKQRMWFIENSEEKWFNDLLDIYEKEMESEEGITKRDVKKVKEFQENIKKFDQERNNEADKCIKKKALIQKVFIEIHMMVLIECKKAEWEKEKENFFKTIIKESEIQENLGEEANVLEKVGRGRSWTSTLEKKKEEIKKWKKEKWFLELMLEMKNKEKRYIKEINKEMLVKKNEGTIKNPMLERQKIIWKKHWDDIHKKWIEKGNKEWFEALFY